MRSVFFIFSLVCLLSCFNKGDCLITSTNLAKINLLRSLDGNQNTTSFSLVEEVDSLNTFVIYRDTLNVTSLALPLNPNRTESSFVMITTESDTLNLTLTYTPYTNIISSDCGAYLYFKNLKVKASNFDSTRLINPQLLISVSKNLEVFY